MINARPPMPPIRPVGRIRRSPFHDAVLAEGAESFLTYNRMLIPRGYGDTEAEYRRLTQGVAMWDVAAQRQVELRGPDAAKLAQVLASRDLSAQAVGQGKYVALCDHRGVLINDPIALKLAPDRYWLSVSDSDIWTWARAVTGERGLNVTVGEPDASPLAIQGPRAEDTVAALLGGWVRDLRYFWFREATLEGCPLIVSRSGWSKQGGFELYLLDAAQGSKLWSLVREAGAQFDIGPGNPNPTERTESGLLNWDVDTDGETNPFEVRLGRFVDLDLPDDVIGMAALKRIAAEGPRRHLLGIALDTAPAPEDQAAKLIVLGPQGDPVGHMTHRAWSYRLGKTIGYGLVSRDVGPGDVVTVMGPDGPSDGVLSDLPFALP
ncbi:MAG: glycine cleavage T C-terminal barrel domain-containing protein [Pseudomonadota bacterium]